VFLHHFVERRAPESTSWQELLRDKNYRQPETSHREPLAAGTP
jgi:hypothetical protein